MKIFMCIVVILLLAGLLALSVSVIIDPEGWWRATEKWKSNATRSSYYYDRYTRFGAAVMAVIAAGGIVWIIYAMCNPPPPPPSTPEEVKEFIKNFNENFDVTAHYHTTIG